MAAELVVSAEAAETSVGWSTGRRAGGDESLTGSTASGSEVADSTAVGSVVTDRTASGSVDAEPPGTSAAADSPGSASRPRLTVDAATRAGMASTAAADGAPRGSSACGVSPTNGGWPVGASRKSRKNSRGGSSPLVITTGAKKAIPAKAKAAETKAPIPPPTARGLAAKAAFAISRPAGIVIGNAIHDTGVNTIPASVAAPFNRS